MREKCNDLCEQRQEGAQWRYLDHVTKWFRHASHTGAWHAPLGCLMTPSLPLHTHQKRNKVKSWIYISDDYYKNTKNKLKDWHRRWLRHYHSDPKGQVCGVTCYKREWRIELRRHMLGCNRIIHHYSHQNLPYFHSFGRSETFKINFLFLKCYNLWKAVIGGKKIICFKSHLH